jgi:hypothetical protein
MNRATGKPPGGLARAVLALDELLRKRQGIYEYSAHAWCIFRVEDTSAETLLVLRDGTRIQPGDPILRLHLWNEQVPRMSRTGASIGWARRASRAVELSLGELARAFRDRPAWSRVSAVCADMKLASSAESAQLLRIVDHYGFEMACDARHPRGHVLRDAGENILGAMLVLATNPFALRFDVLRRANQPIYMSRRLLMGRYLTRS